MSVAYFHLKDTSTQIHCAFAMGKARLASLREILVSRLELTASVISVRRSNIILAKTGYGNPASVLLD